MALYQAVTYLRDSLRLAELRSEARDFCRNPVGIRDRSNYVSAGRRMLLFDLSEMGTRKPVGNANQRWPEPSMNECDLSTYNAANKNIIVVSHRAGQCEYLFALRMGPPTSLDRSLCNCLCQGENRSATRLQHDTMFSNKFDSLVGSHLWPITANPRAWVFVAFESDRHHCTLVKAQQQSAIGPQNCWMPPCRHLEAATEIISPSTARGAVQRECPGHARGRRPLPCDLRAGRGRRPR